jgi:hypothetical protein
MMQRPTYAVDSIDHTLAPLELLTQRDAARPRPVAETELARTAVLANRWTSPL